MCRKAASLLRARSADVRFGLLHSICDALGAHHRRLLSANSALVLCRIRQFHTMFVLRLRLAGVKCAPTPLLIGWGDTAAAAAGGSCDMRRARVGAIAIIVIINQLL